MREGQKCLKECKFLVNFLGEFSDCFVNALAEIGSCGDRVRESWVESKL